MLEPAQLPYMSEQCSTGSVEAERLFQLGGDYHRGRKGVRVDPDKAERLYNESMAMGNAKAALNLAGLYLYRHDYGTRGRFEDEKVALQYIEKAVDMGCPEGLYSLAALYSRGWGVEKDQKKAKALIKQAAEKGGLNAMVAYGMALFDAGKEEEGIAWLEKSLALGNGDAATNLSLLYARKGNIEALIRAVRQGCRLGSLTALVDLSMIYNGGMYGQEKDKDYARTIMNIVNKIKKSEQAKPIPNFDALVPPRSLFPFRGKE